ncbi:hypothetical protein CWB99_02430 [Pseudoalteromonas rubra]|uniref:Uncharacterized protein n=1 Tax=Pseudoalteromonas rubra TaxID=43658 RepID=A0A5S3WSB7_9GAMM|nr:hypothetical protein CWC00_19300 [Pseudoalteromonas rubra]TMP32078.1 hypothetical protein CWB99_02430 [Pseudoalteromonas rubra]
MDMADLLCCQSADLRPVDGAGLIPTRNAYRLLVAMTHPKAIVFTAAVFPQFILTVQPQPCVYLFSVKAIRPSSSF